MSAPKRIQLRRTNGWRKPEGAIVVARPSKWGNPVPLSQVKAVEESDRTLPPLDTRAVRYFAVEWYRTWLAMDEATELLSHLEDDLRGHDLACWCPLDQPCHADVLLEWANR